MQIIKNKQVTITIDTGFTDSKPCLKISWLHWKSGSSNPLVDKTYLVVALRTLVLAFVSNELLPKGRVFIKTGSERPRRLLSIFSMVLRRVLLSVMYMGQWRRQCTVGPISKPQLLSRLRESWKQCFNLCSHKWLTPSHHLVINLIPLGLWLLKKLLTDSLINFRILFLKILKLLEFLVLIKFFPFNDSWQKEFF